MRIAASTYLNSAPLIYSFTSGMQRNRAIFIGDAAPARCAQMLANGQCDIALIPVIEYLRIPNLRIIPNVAVASKNRIESVILATKCEPHKISKIALDSSSRTSQTLVKILMANRFHHQPIYCERLPDPGCANMFEVTDAALVIGDPAFHVKDNAERLHLKIYDLAEEWRALTDLPFVFAVWVVREDALPEYHRFKLDFEMAKREGLERAHEIAEQYATVLNKPPAELFSYLTKNVNYELDGENLAGLREYFRYAFELGFVEQNKELLFVP